MAHSGDNLYAYQYTSHELPTDKINAHPISSGAAQNCHSEQSEESAFSGKADPFVAIRAPQDDTS